MVRKLYTENEIVLCTYIARFGRDSFSEEKIILLEDRSINSVRMKVSNIAAMLSEEGYKYSPEVSCLSGVPPGEKGRRTNWNIVEKLLSLEEHELKERCNKIFEL